MEFTKRLKYILLIVTVCLIIPFKAFADDVKSNDLIDNAKEFDGKSITYSGEVIGDIMKRGDYAWINVNDGDNAIGIWVPYSETQKITFTGVYGTKGDIIRVTGAFHRACPEHGGDFDIHSMSIEILEKGEAVPIPVDNIKLYIAAIALAAAVLLSIAMLKRRA